MMTIADVLSKVIAGTELTAGEKEFLAGYREPVPDTDREKEMADKLKEVQGKLDAVEREQLTEQERQQADLEKAQADNEQLRRDLAEVQSAKAAQDHDLAVRKLATEHKFRDPDYLTYLIGRDKVDLAKDGKTYLAGLERDAPQYFDAVVNTGGGGGAGDPTEGKGGRKAELDGLLGKATLTNSEVARVIEIQGELAKNDSSSK